MTATRMPFILVICLFFYVSFAYGHGRGTHDRPVFIGDCGLIGRVADVGQLSKFKRMNGPYRVNTKSKFWRIVTYHESEVLIPTVGKQRIVPFDRPFKGVRYVDPTNQLSVSVFTTKPEMRSSLGQITSKRIYREYGQAPLFSYLTEALGTYVDGFCAKGMPKKRVAMFMSSFVAPLDGTKTRVYRIDHPIDAILMVPAVQIFHRIELILPAKQKNSLNLVFVTGQTKYLHSILGTLEQSRHP